MASPTNLGRNSVIRGKHTAVTHIQVEMLYYLLFTNYVYVICKTNTIAVQVGSYVVFIKIYSDFESTMFHVNKSSLWWWNIIQPWQPYLLILKLADVNRFFFGGTASASRFAPGTKTTTTWKKWLGFSWMTLNFYVWNMGGNHHSY